MPPFLAMGGFDMTIQEAIAQSDATNPNAYSVNQKITWLSRADAMVKNDVIDAHEGAEKYPFSGYDDNTNTETVLIMPQPYDECYIHWLQAQVHYANDDFDRYNCSILMFKSLLDDFKSFYKKHHTPVGCGRFRF